MNFYVVDKDTDLLRSIVQRCIDIYKDGEFGAALEANKIQLHISLQICNLNGCKLDFIKMFEASDCDIAHDVIGIHNNICTETGQLLNEFRPRYTKKEFKDEFNQ